MCRQLPTPGEAVSGESRPQESNQLVPRSDSLGTAQTFWNSDTGKEKKKKTIVFDLVSLFLGIYLAKAISRVYRHRFK